MFKQVDQKDLALFTELSKSERPATRADVPTRVLIPAFVLSELKTAFEIGFLILIPFLVIDMVVASTVMSMGMVMLPLWSSRSRSRSCCSCWSTAGTWCPSPSSAAS